MTKSDALELELLNNDPDVGLMIRVRDDVAGAFESIVERYQPRLLGILAHLVGSVEEAEDLTQEVFLRLYRSRKTYRPKARFSTWLFTIANHLALNHLRGRGRNPIVALGLGGGGNDSTAANAVPGLGATDGQGTPSSHLRKSELAEVVREALDGLAEDQRMAVLLSKFEGMSYAEIAEVMDRSEAAVKSLLARARLNLRDRLEPYLEAGKRIF